MTLEGSTENAALEATVKPRPCYGVKQESGVLEDNRTCSLLSAENPELLTSKQDGGHCFLRQQRSLGVTGQTQTGARGGGNEMDEGTEASL